MKVLVACEESQIVCKEFRKLGHEAYSCDLESPSGGHPEWHILGDAIEAISGGEIVTMDGIKHNVGKWDMLIAHPPCTYLTNAGTKHFSLEKTAPEKVVRRWEERAKAAVFFMQFALASIPKICVENPVGFMNGAYRRPDQIIHPYMFAKSTEDKENYVTKRTCLWLYNLPLLQGNNIQKPVNAEIWGHNPSGKPRTWTDTFSRSNKVRSKTFTGIARAMAEQWGGNIMKNYIVEFKTESGAYQNVIGDYIQATSPADALSLARQWLVDNGMEPIEVSALSYFNKIREEGDSCRVWTL